MSWRTTQKGRAMNQRAALPAIFAACTIASCSPAVGTVCPLQVSSASELSRAWTCAPPGAVIQLAAGDYGELRIANRTRGEITIRSGEAEDPAEFTSLTIASSSGVTIENLRFTRRPLKQAYGLLVVGSQGVHVQNSEFAGPGTEGETRPLAAVMLRDSTGLAIRRSHFSRYRHGIALLNVGEVIIADNRFADLQTDGIRGGGASNIVIERNKFTNFHPAPKDHPDGIQLWSTQQTKSAHNIAIRDNLIYRGTGAPTQGIFVRDTFGQAPFENVSITNNIVLGGLFNGITVAGVRQGKIFGNTVIPFPDQDSRIRLEAANDTELAGNVAGRFVLRGDIRNIDNKTVLPRIAVEDIVRRWQAERDTNQ